MSSWAAALPFFSKEELACRHCGKINLNLNFAAALVVLRYAVEKPLSPTSVCRCPDHNSSVGGHPRSMHLTENPVHDTDGCAAADILWDSWPDDEKLAFCRAAWLIGFSLGLSKIFCHIDLRSHIVSASMPRAIFHYSGWHSPFDDEQIKEGLSNAIENGQFR